MSINRTYQGRVSSVHEILDKKLNRGRELPKQEWKPLLTKHLSLFQAATNYYLTCFAACAQGSDVPALKNLFHKLTESWVTHEYRKSGEAKGFRALLSDALPHFVRSEDSFAGVANRIIDDSIPRETLHLAIEALLTDLGGESSIQQGGRSYLPYFCSPNTKANFPRSAKLLERERAKAELPHLLHNGAITHETLRSDYDIHHFATLTQGQAPIAGETLRENLTKWIAHLEKENLLTIDQAQNWNNESANLPDSTSIPHYNGAAAKGAEKNRLYAFICLKVLPPAPDKLQVLRSTFPEPKPAKEQKTPTKLTSAQQKKIEAAKREDRLRSLGADPIEEARGERRFIFQSFSSRLSRTAPADGPTWTEFDIAAFKQALTALNQVDQKIVERTNELTELKEQIAYFDSKEGKPRNADEPVTFFNDPRRALVEDLEKELSKLLHSDFGDSQYSLSRGTIKGWPIIRDGYRKLISKNADTSEKELIESIIHKFQKRTKNIGSIQLFELLAQAKFRPLWTPVSENEVATWRRNEWSQDFLTDYIDYRILKSDAEHLEDNLEVNLTPAHLSRSRRPIMLSDLGGASKVIHRDLSDQQSLVTSFFALDPEAGVPREKRFEICYSAPRLKRDELTGGENRSLLQPLVKGLGLELPALSEVAEKPKPLAVSLMPDWYASSPRLRKDVPDRFLLNFPAKLETDWITKALGKAHLFNPAQFNGPNDDPLHLHWPETIKLKKGEVAWWEKSEIIKNGFTVAAFDLGLRGAAASTIYQVVSDLALVPNNKRPYSRHIGSTKSHRWHAYPLSRKMLRLPGEDQHLYDPTSGKFQREPGGKKGRKAAPSDSRCYQSLLESSFSPYIDLDERDLHVPVYFLEQNKKLLRFTKYLLAYLSNCHRTLIQLKAGVAPEGRKLTSLQSRIQSIVKEDNPATACEALTRQIRDIRSHLDPLLTTLANRILPGKKFQWTIEKGELVELTNREGQREKFVPHTLKRKPRPSVSQTKIYSQGGLHAQRIEAIEDLRRRLTSFQREVNRTIGIEPTIGYGRNSGSVPDAAPELLEKLDRLKEQRVKQTAHLILTHALGLRLKGESKTPSAERADFLHGEYEIAPNGRVADMIVIENLDRYRTDQGRSRRENRQLMSWSHRAITDVLREITAPFGIPLLAVAASYSSKFCATTGRPGFRAVEISPQQHDCFLLKNWACSDDPVRKNLADQIGNILERYQDKKGFKLLLPQDGGPLFVPAFDPKQEDCSHFTVGNAALNAAGNLCLRAISAPGKLDLLHRFRVKTSKNVLNPRCENIREKTAFNPKDTLNPVSTKEIRSELLARKFTTFFYAGEGDAAQFWTPFDLFEMDKTFLMSGNAMSRRISQLELSCIVALNNQTLATKNIPERLSPSYNKQGIDKIPM